MLKIGNVLPGKLSITHLPLTLLKIHFPWIRGLRGQRRKKAGLDSSMFAQAVSVSLGYDAPARLALKYGVGVGDFGTVCI